jgi:hypothetical protein
MPAVPLYLHRLEDAIATLDSLPRDWIDRRTLEEALSLSKWTAWRILKAAGATEGPGNTLVCRRQDLLAHLRALQQNPHFAPEIARHRRLDSYLASIARYATRKHQEIARDQAAEALLSSRFQNLPRGVELEPGALRITFSGTSDFLRKFGAVVYALQNDFEKIQEFIENAS